MKREKVYLLGGSGSMGFETFKNIWTCKDESGNRKYDIVLLLRNSRKNQKLFLPYIRQAGIRFWKQQDVIEQNGFKIIWGDGRNYNDIAQGMAGVDWVLNCMALISPKADHYPDIAKAVNIKGLENIIRAIKEEPGGTDHIKLINVGSIAQYGDRMNEIHMGRVGDPLMSSPFDVYSVTKIKAERILLESGLKYWVQLRQTFIMIPNLFSLEDPLMFHQPVNSFMENITVKDAGRVMANCLQIPEDSPFWRNVYNCGGGPACRTNYYDFLKMMFGMMGLRLEKIFDRNWFALRNFHMLYYQDSDKLNNYLKHWNDSIEDFTKLVWEKMPFFLKFTANLCKKSKLVSIIAEKIARRRMKKMVLSKNGTLNWYSSKNDLRIAAFYGSYEAFENIPDWDAALPSGLNGTPTPKTKILDHGYNESKTKLELSDLQLAAKYRGGKLISTSWDGEMHTFLEWECAFGHKFETTPFTILKAGHWCSECEPPDWNYDEIARHNKFFAQVWYASHSPEEDFYYPERCYEDIF
ncbi:MAG TPA: NAD(P)-dependent oxidoreductase [Bacteroidales bacterium]|nr:NAD(P)-dependent oxidoreductase [Bacteroidales bacterium]